MRPIVAAYFLVVLVSASVLADGPIWKEESKLRHRIFSRYESGVIPQIETGRPVEVGLVLSVINLKAFTDIGAANLNGWLTLTWKDARLVWNSTQHAGITAIRVKPDLIWKPDIALYNGLNRVEILTQKSEALAVVGHDGNVLMVPPTSMSAPCVRDNGHYNITMKFGSWTYDGNMLDLQFYAGENEVDFDSYVPNKEFSVLSGSGEREVKHYPCCSEPYPSIQFNITIYHRI